MRQVAPVSPALHLGADRIFVIGTAKIRNESPDRTRGDLFPSLAQIAGHVMNSISSTAWPWTSSASSASTAR